MLSGCHQIIEFRKPPASKVPCIQASKHPSLQACKTGVYHLPLGAAARPLSPPQGLKPCVPPATGIHENPPKSFKNIAPVDKSDVIVIKNVQLSQNPETRLYKTIQKRTTIAKSEETSSKVCPEFFKRRPWQSKLPSGRLWFRVRWPRRLKMDPMVSKMIPRDTKKAPRHPKWCPGAAKSMTSIQIP